MDNYIGIIVFNIVTITMFLVMYYINSASNKGIYFGIRIPGKYENEVELKVLDKEYKKVVLVIMIIITIIINSILFKVVNLSEEILGSIITFFTIIIILAFQIPFIIYYRKIKKLKLEKGWNVKSNNVVVVDTTLRKPKKNEKIKIVPTKYFFMLLIIPIIMLVLTFSLYRTLPEIMRVPTGSYEEFNKTTLKGIITLYSMPITQILLGMLFIFINMATMTSRVDLNSGSIDIAIERKKKFRRLGSIFIFMTAIEVMVMLSITQLSILYGFEIKLIEYIISGIILITMIIFTCYLIKVGQGGRNISENKEEDELYKDDDSKWILGSFYYNRNDPAIMIEKRVGIGWTINFGNTKAIIIFVIILLICIGASIIDIM